MKQIKKDELYQHLGDFLKSKGVEFKPGAYTDRIQRGCSLLSDVINASQSGLARAKVETEKKLDQLRQVIHEKTAPKAPSASPGSANPPTAKRQPTKSKPAPQVAASKPVTHRAAKKRMAS
jgi:hypothetical protein